MKSDEVIVADVWRVRAVDEHWAAAPSTEKCQTIGAGESRGS